MPSPEPPPEPPAGMLPPEAPLPVFPRVAHLVSHTHWDREWYLPFSTFRVMLVRMLRGVLDALEHDDAYQHFCLDGQTVALEDYLEIVPEDEARLRRLVAAGALAIGPWYVLPDEFLIPPEATVRNLVVGASAGARIGPVQKVGYLPDAFGHPAQLPQILRRAGIDSFLYMRGDDDESAAGGLEWTWRAPDGSEVLAIHLLDSYCNTSALGAQEMWHAHTPREVSADRAVEQVHDRFIRMGARSDLDVRLLMNGCDHLPLQKDFGRMLAAIRDAYPDTEFRHGSFADYLAAVRASDATVPVHAGELRGGKRHHVLSGVWSTRMPLKQRNDEAHTWLADVWEPLQSWALVQHGLPYPTGLLDHAWRLFLKNQPHDSICGCSVDEVHAEMGPRFDRVMQTCERTMQETLQAVVPTFGRTPAGDRDPVLAVFHALPERRTAVVDRLVILEPLEYDVDALRVVDERGRSLPFEIIERHQVRRFWGIDWRTELDGERQRARFRTYARELGHAFLEPRADIDGPVDTFLRLRVLADLPPVGLAELRLEERAGEPIPEIPAGSRVTVEAPDTLANDHVRVRLRPDGTFDLEDLGSGARFPLLNLLEDVEDVGDEYDYSPAERSETLTSAGVPGSVSVVEQGVLGAVLEARFALELPQRITADRAARSDVRVTCPVCVRLGLTANAPVVDVDVEFENLAEDHRLGAVFASGIPTDTLVSDAHFWLAERPVDGPAGEDWAQPPPDTVPQQGFTCVESGGRGLAVLNRGLPEIAARRTGDGSVDLRLTLLRSVGWLSRDDFPTRRSQNAGPTVPTPDAQCLGRHRFRYAVMPFAGDPVEADVKGWSRRWRTPLACVQGVRDGARPSREGLFRLASRRTSVTAVKRHEERETLVVRLYNLEGRTVDEELALGFDAAGAWRCDLLEARESKLPVREGRSVALSLGRHEIATIEVEPSTPP